MSPPTVPPPPPPGGDHGAGATAWAVPPPAPPFDSPGAPAPLAEWGSRALALIIDGLVGTIAMLAALVPAVIVGFGLAQVNETLGVLTGFLLGLAGYAAVLVTFVIMEAGPYGQTPGKHVMGIRVVYANGYTLSRGMSVVRYLAKNLSALPLYIGYLWPLWDPQRRTFHDMVLDTRVVVAPQRAPSIPALIRAAYTGRPG